MGQAFSKRALLFTKLAAIGIAGMLAAGAVTAYQHFDGPYRIGDAPPQPIAFSHKHHVGDDGIDCRFCHAGVETSSFAGIPATRTCMTCHSQLFTDAPMLEPLRESAARGEPLHWTRVHRLPDFAYFDHSIHVRKGVGCIECHGRVDRMPLMRRVAPLTMQWCLDCHRDPTPHLRDPAHVFDMTPTPAARLASGIPNEALATRRRLTDCSTCHR
jgi:hypothetical protein